MIKKRGSLYAGQAGVRLNPERRSHGLKLNLGKFTIGLLIKFGLFQTLAFQHAFPLPFPLQLTHLEPLNTGAISAYPLY